MPFSRKTVCFPGSPTTRRRLLTSLAAQFAAVEMTRRLWSLGGKPEVFNSQTHLIPRDVNLEKYISTGLIVIISGIRRCGKSSLLFLIKETMKLPEASYCYFNFDDERVQPEKDVFTEILALHLEMYGKEPVLFFDEVQNIPGWEKFINRMYEQGLKVFVTGSNARLLSSEISGSLTGRNRVLKLFPFSFSEYLRYIGHSYNPEQLSSKNKALLLKDFNHYSETGGFPMVVKENDTELMHAYFQDILYRDWLFRSNRATDFGHRVPL